MSKIIKFKSIRFFDFKFNQIISRLKNTGGLLVAPAASALVDIEKNKTYYNSLKYSDIAIFDSGFLCILFSIFKRIKVKKLSGYLFLKKLLKIIEFRNRKFFLIDPSIYEQKLNYNLLRKKNIINQRSYVSPKYVLSNFKDLKLLAQINSYRPDIIIINIGGGIQEPLGLFLKDNIKKKNTIIICTGAAIGFITKVQAPINLFYDKFYLGWLVRLLHKPKNYYPRVIKSLKLINFFKKKY